MDGRTKFNSLLKMSLKAAGATDVKVYDNELEVTGFATMPSGQVLFFSWCVDARGPGCQSNISLSARRLLMRKAKDYRDFDGDDNHFCDFSSYEIQRLAQGLSK